MRGTTFNLFFLILISWLLTHAASASDPVLPRIENSLPQEKLARYNDSFDTFREELWEKVGFIPDRDKQAGEPKLAELSIEKGTLRLETKTGCFSLGGLISKFFVKGDYDIQIECHPRFVQEAADMDQIVMLSLIDKTKELQDEELESVNIGLSKVPGRPPFLFTGVRQAGVFQRGKIQPAEHFKGTLRVTRAGTRVSTMFKRQEDRDWTPMSVFTRPANDLVVSFKVQNFNLDRTSIGASVPFVVYFDDLRLNAAQNVIESEI
jgi:hypothetical protein